MKRLKKIQTKHSKKKNSFFKKHAIANIVIALLILATIPLLRFTEVRTENGGKKDAPLHSSAVEIEEKGMLTLILPIDKMEYKITNNNNSQAIKGEGALERSHKLTSGKYLIEFKDIYGYKGAETKEVEVKTGEETVVLADYYPIFGTPVLGVKVFPEFGKYKIINKDTQKELSFQGSQFMNLPPGNYTIEFLDSDDVLEYYKSPGKSDFRLTERMNATINAAYSEVKE